MSTLQTPGSCYWHCHHGLWCVNTPFLRFDVYYSVIFAVCNYLVSIQYGRADSDFFESGSNPVLQILNPNPLLIRYQSSTSNLTLVWLGLNLSKANNQKHFFSKNKIQSGSGYSKEKLSPDPVGGSRSLDPKIPKSSPCTPLVYSPENSGWSAGEVLRRDQESHWLFHKFFMCYRVKQHVCVKYLGVLIDSNLNWSSHVQLVRSKLSRASHLLFKIRKFVSIVVLKMLYYSFVYCHLQYCIMSWGTANNSILQPLNVLHNNILRIMTFSIYSCYVTALYKNLSVLKLNCKYRLELAKFMHKLHHGALPKIFDNFFKIIYNSYSYKTRFADNQNYFMQRVCANSKKSISYRGLRSGKKAKRVWKPCPMSLSANIIRIVS